MMRLRDCFIGYIRRLCFSAIDSDFGLDSTSGEYGLEDCRKEQSQIDSAYRLSKIEPWCLLPVDILEAPWFSC